MSNTEKADEAKQTQAQFALKQLQQREQLIRNAKRWSPLDSKLGIAFWLAFYVVIISTPLHHMQSLMNQLLYFMCVAAMALIIPTHKRIDALIKLLEQDSLLRKGEREIKSQ